jgi:hypothetical protein
VLLAGKISGFLLIGTSPDELTKISGYQIMVSFTDYPNASPCATLIEDYILRQGPVLKTVLAWIPVDVYGLVVCLN